MKSDDRTARVRFVYHARVWLQTEFKRHEVLLPINNENLNSRENKKFSSLKKAPIKESAHCFYDDWNRGCD